MIYFFVRYSTRPGVMTGLFSMIGYPKGSIVEWTGSWMISISFVISMSVNSNPRQIAFATNTAPSMESWNFPRCRTVKSDVSLIIFFVRPCGFS